MASINVMPKIHWEDYCNYFIVVYRKVRIKREGADHQDHTDI